MKIYNRFRMSACQFSLVSKKLDSKEKEQIIVGICGQGKLKYHNQQRLSYSLTNKISLIEKDALTDFIADNNDAKAVVLFHHYNEDEIDALLKRDLIIGQANNLISKSLTLLSCILFENGDCVAHIISGQFNLQANASCVVGDDIKFIFNADDPHYSELNKRTGQAFGKVTVKLLSNLSIGIVGASGTGSIVAEQLYRLGVKELVLVDNEKIENNNLNRILNSSKKDVKTNRNKTTLFKKAVRRSGMPTSVIAIPTEIANVNTIRYLSQCDIIFGCMDSIDGRHQLNRLCVFYSIPYIDLGVKLKADGLGGISEISGAVHYVKPDGSSLMSRGVYNQKSLEAASLLRSNPEEYRARLKEKYIIGAQEESPAVISVNMLVASLAVNDFLARIHPYRDEQNSDVETIRIDLTGLRIRNSSPSAKCKLLSNLIGLGDQKPLLRMPILSEV